MATRTPRVLYALVARQVNVLAEFMADEVHFQVSQIVRMVLRQISVHDQEKSLEYAEDYFFHCIIREGISFVCLTDKDFSFRKARAFLEDVRSEFMGAYGDQAHTAHTFAFNAEFAPVLQGRITFFNTDKSAEQSMDKLGITQQKINATIDQMQTNIESVLERGEKLDLLVEKTEQLDQAAFKFERSAKELKQAIYCKRIKTMACVSCVLLVVLFFIAVLACGGLSFKECKN
uniref:V-SNARE coiled-coil homology domain-containing protein n=1 Tax=Rhizochromulina marina TaxID=1034831 RepID=A0A7S2SPH5_9STRA|mmetsp:Transcript_3569/g.10395  ORF Transcript_3569/g.10395 Transcript_3569/m.10395 type:complete len:232 (+) Transcript_3569:177-872(+)